MTGRGERAPAECSDFCRRRFAVLELAAAKCDVGAGTRKLQCDGAAEASTPAGYDRDFAGEIGSRASRCHARRFSAPSSSDAIDVVRARLDRTIECAIVARVARGTVELTGIVTCDILRAMVIRCDAAAAGEHAGSFATSRSSYP
jgi:hypothetical protein